MSTSGATIYIEQFDQAQNLDTLGRVDYRADFEAPTTDVKLRTLVDIDVIREAFRFKSDGNDFDEETARARYVTGKDIIPYNTADVNTHYGYYKEDDHANGIAASLDFVQQLARVVFGSVSAIDLFSNEDDVADAYKEAIITCGNRVRSIPTGTLQLDDDQITNDEAAVAGVFVDNIVHDSSSKELVSKVYTFSDASTDGDLILEVTVVVTDGTPKFTNVKVVKPGSGYTSGEEVTMTDGESVATKIKVTLSYASLHYVNRNLKALVSPGASFSIADGEYEVRDASTHMTAKVTFATINDTLTLTYFIVETPKTNTDTNVSNYANDTDVDFEFLASGIFEKVDTVTNTAASFTLTPTPATLPILNGTDDNLNALVSPGASFSIADGEYEVRDASTHMTAKVTFASNLATYFIVETPKTSGSDYDTTGVDFEFLASGIFEKVDTVTNTASSFTLIPTDATLPILNGTADNLNNRGGKAAQDVLSGLLKLKPERFEFTSCCSLGTGFAAGDDYNKTGLEVATTEAGTNPKTGNTNTTSGSNAKFDVIIHDGVLKSVSVNTRGNGYVLGNVLTVTVDSDSDSNKTVTITLDDVFLNYVNAFDENAFSAIPINEGDKLQMIFHISSHPGQQDASGDPVYISRSALIELQVYQQQQEDTTSLKQP